MFVFFCSLNALSPSPMGFKNKPQVLAFATFPCLTWKTLDWNFAWLSGAFSAISCHQEIEGGIIQLEDFPSNSSFQQENSGPERWLLPLGRNWYSSLAELQVSTWIWVWASFYFNLPSLCCFVCLLRHRGWVIKTATAAEKPWARLVQRYTGNELKKAATDAFKK